MYILFGCIITQALTLERGKFADICRFYICLILVLCVCAHLNNLALLRKASILPTWLPLPYYISEAKNFKIPFYFVRKSYTFHNDPRFLTVPHPIR